MTWQTDVQKIHEAAIKPSGIEPWSPEDTRFLALALAGEVGEMANILKKEWRGDFETSLEWKPAVRKELADIRIYLHLLATALAIDLDKAVEEKLPEIRAKFAAPMPIYNSEAPNMGRS